MGIFFFFFQIDGFFLLKSIKIERHCNGTYTVYNIFSTCMYYNKTGGCALCTIQLSNHGVQSAPWPLFFFF